MRRIEQLNRFLFDGERLGWSFARAALRPWAKREPFAIAVPGAGDVIVRGDDSDISTLRSVFGNRDYEVPSAPVRDRLQARMAAIAAQGQVPLIVDAGANIGAASIWFEAHYPLARVLAVEPDPGNCALLRRNCEGRQRITVIEAAIGGDSGRVELVSHGASDAARTVRSETGVALMTMDQLVASVPRAVPFIAKIDIEGFEADLFARNTGWIDSFEAIMIELHDWMLPGMGSSASFQHEMGSRAGYEVFLRGENLIYVRGQR